MIAGDDESEPSTTPILVFLTGLVSVQSTQLPSANRSDA